MYVQLIGFSKFFLKYLEGWYNTQRIHAELYVLTYWEACFEKTKRNQNERIPARFG